MNVTLLRTDEIYKKMINSPKEKRDDIYRYEIAKPFEFKWSCYNVPLTSRKKDGYDVVMASNMFGYLPPSEMDESQEHRVNLISENNIWQTCKKTIEDCLECFTKAGYELPVKDYIFSIMLGDPKSPYLSLSDGYLGDGGIPGYILVVLIPDEYTIRRIPVALAHECNHNVRFQFEEWRNDITLGEMMVCEGLAENFATSMFGEEMVGPWVSKTDMDTLNNYIKPLIREALDATGFDNISSYLWGDELAKIRGFFPQGMPYCAGYACGYHMIKYYLKKTGKSIVDATLTPANNILKEIEGFWNEQSV